MRQHPCRIVVCSNCETLRPFSLPSYKKDDFDHFITEEICGLIREMDTDPRMYLDADDSFQRWNGGKFSDQRAHFGWAGGTSRVVCASDAPKYVSEYCEKIEKRLNAVIDEICERLEAEDRDEMC